MSYASPYANLYMLPYCSPSSYASNNQNSVPQAFRNAPVLPLQFSLRYQYVDPCCQARVLLAVAADRRRSAVGEGPPMSSGLSMKKSSERMKRSTCDGDPLLDI